MSIERVNEINERLSEINEQTAMLHAERIALVEERIHLCKPIGYSAVKEQLATEEADMAEQLGNTGGLA